MTKFLNYLKKPGTIYVLATIGVLLFVAIGYYHEAWKLHYLVPFGDDAEYHIRRSMEMIQAGRLTFDGIYPPLYHAMVAILSKITGQSVLRLTMLIYPLLVPLAGGAVACLAAKTFNPRVGFFAALMLVASPHPRWYLNDGAYPQIVGADILLILLLTLFIGMYRQRKLSIAAPFIILAISFIHPVSFIYTIVLTILYLAILMVIWLKTKEPWLWRAGGYILSALLVSAAAVWKLYLGSAVEPIVRELLHQGTSAILAVPEKLDSFNGFIEKPVALASLPGYIGPVIFYLGLASTVLILIKYLKTEKTKFALVFIIGWAAIMFILSRTSFTLWPYRFARDLTFPLVILAAYLSDQLLHEFGRHRIFGSIIVSLFSLIFLFKIGSLAKAEKVNDNMRLTSADYQVLQWIKSKTPTDANILASPLTPYFEILTERKLELDYHTLLLKEPGAIYQELADHHISYVYLREKPKGWIPPNITDWNWGYNTTKLKYLELEKIPGVKTTGPRLYHVKLNQ